MNRNSKEFKDLKAKWDKKLEKSGFKDIEQDEDRLKTWASKYFFARYEPGEFEARQEYYRMATHFLNDHKFSNKTEYLIWDLHCQGISIRSITTKLKRKRLSVYKRQVHEIIQKLSEMMVKDGLAKT